MLLRKAFRRKRKILAPSSRDQAVAGGDRCPYCYFQGKGIEPLSSSGTRTGVHVCARKRGAKSDNGVTADAGPAILFKSRGVQSDALDLMVKAKWIKRYGPSAKGFEVDWTDRGKLAMEAVGYVIENLGPENFNQQLWWAVGTLANMEFTSQS